MQFGLVGFRLADWIVPWFTIQLSTQRTVVAGGKASRIGLVRDGRQKVALMVQERRARRVPRRLRLVVEDVDDLNFGVCADAGQRTTADVKMLLMVVVVMALLGRMLGRRVVVVVMVIVRCFRWMACMHLMRVTVDFVKSSGEEMLVGHSRWVLRSIDDGIRGDHEVTQIVRLLVRNGLCIVVSPFVVGFRLAPFRQRLSFDRRFVIVRVFEGYEASR